MTAVQWVAQTTPVIAQYGDASRLLDEDKWREWASDVISIPQIAAVGAPLPAGFATWQEWALRFNEAVMLLNS